MSLFTAQRIVVVGDIMLDEYIHGETVRLSPEAPVPIVKVGKTEYRLGGAGNVAANIASLGGNPALIGILGTDDHGEFVVHQMNLSGLDIQYLCLSTERPTTTKTRITVNRHQIARLDTEKTHYIDRATENKLITRLQSASDGASAVVVSDYSKGVITPRIMGEIAATGLPLFIDPKISNAVTYYGFKPGTIMCMTPNIAEARGIITDSGHMEPAALAAAFMRKFGCDYTLLTQGDEGMTLVKSLHAVALHIPTFAQEVFDVAGAGDTVIAALALAHVLGYSMENAARIANYAAGVAVGKSGTHAVTYDELYQTPAKIFMDSGNSV